MYALGDIYLRYMRCGAMFFTMERSLHHHFESLFNCTLISEGRKVGGYIVMTAKRSNCQNWDVDMRRPTRFFNIWEEAKR